MIPLLKSSLRKLNFLGLGFFVSVVVLSQFAWADTVDNAGSSGILSTASSEDWASACLNFLFYGSPLPNNLSQYGARLTPLTEAFRQALSVYSIAMLIVAGIVLFYHLTSIIAETAHQGVVMGRRTNQIWAPIRLAVAVILLVPMGNGLSAGQHLIIKIASSGSNLASKAWQTFFDTISEDFSVLVNPRPPDTAALVAISTEMELCRLIYEQTFNSLQNDAAVRLAGPLTDIIKIPSTRTNSETWRYTNTLNGAVPLCGEFRFTGYRRHGLTIGPYTENIARIYDDLATFSRVEADYLMSHTQPIALQAVTAYTADSGTSANLQNDMDRLSEDLQKQMRSHLLNQAPISNVVAEKYLIPTVDAGWISAGFFIPELVRLQESYGDVIEHMMPQLQGPIFSHPITTDLVLDDTINAEPALRTLDHTLLDSISRFYSRVAHLNERASDWVESSLTTNTDSLPINGFDIRDQMTAASDAEAGFSLLGRALDAAAISRGVWGTGPTDVDPGNPFSVTNHDKSYNPLSVVIEYGRRQWSLGTYLMGLAGNMNAYKSGTGPATATTFLGIAFCAGGLILLFLAPLLPFIRFLLAVVIWLLEVFEAIVAIPLVSLAHLTPSGEGISGSLARQAYMLWIVLAIRPVLTLFGLMLGLLLFTLGVTFLEIALTPLARLASTSNTGMLMTTNVGIVLSFDILVLAMTNMAFKGIYKLPDQALRWLSPFVVTEGRDAVQSPTTVQGSRTVVSAAPILQSSLGGFHRETNTTNTTAKNQSSSSSTNSAYHSALFPVSHRETSTTTSVPSTPSSAMPTVEPSSSQATSFLPGSRETSSSQPTDKKPNPASTSAFFANKDKPNEGV